MKIRGIFGLAGAAIAGIYLTSEEGKLARLSLQKKKTALEPIVKDLLTQANDVISGAKELNSDEIRANIELLVNEAKDSLINLDLERAIDTIKDAVKVASRKINEASNEVSKEKRVSKKTKTTKKPVAKKATTKSTAKATPKAKAKK